MLDIEHFVCTVGPARSIHLETPDTLQGWVAKLTAAGFRMESETVLPPCRYTKDNNGTIRIEQWDLPQ